MKDDAFRVDDIIELDLLEQRYLAWVRSRPVDDLSVLAKKLGISLRTFYRKIRPPEK